MIRKLLEYTFDEWVEKYKPVSDANGNILYFENYGTDYNHLVKQNPLTIWTECDEGDGGYIMSRAHFINRMCYYITEIPFGEDEDVFVNCPHEEEED